MISSESPISDHQWIPVMTQMYGEVFHTWASGMGSNGSTPHLILWGKNHILVMMWQVFLSALGPGDKEMGISWGDTPFESMDDGYR